MNVLHRRSVSHRTLCAMLATLTAFGPATAVLAQERAAPRKKEPARPAAASTAKPAPQAAGALDLNFAVPEACVLVALRPAQFLNSPAAETLPTEVFQAALVKAIGLDPLAAEQIVVSVSPPMPGPPTYSIVARFSKPVALTTAVTRETEQAELNGKTYYKSRSPEPMEPSFFLPDDKTLVVAPDFVLSKLAGQPDAGGGGSLATRLSAAYQGDDLLAMVDVETLRPLINMGVAQAPLPPEVQSLRELPELIKAVELRVNFSRPGNTELIAAANNEVDAEQIVAIYDGIKQMFGQKVAQESERLLSSPDTVEQAGGRYMQRMTKYWETRLQLVREGEQLVLLRANASADPSNQLTYMATVGVLVALLLPAVQAAREAARRNSSMNNMKQIMLGMLNHESVRQSLPAHANYGEDGKPLLSWRVHLLPYLEEQALYQRFHLDEPWDSEHNKQLIPLMPALFVDPSGGLAPAEGKTHYLGVEGKDFLFDGTAESRQLRDLTDGTSNTIAVVQVSNEKAVTWTKPEDWQPDENEPLKGLGALHAGVFPAGFCDGSVTVFAEGIDAGVFKAFLTIAGGEAVQR